MRDRYDHIRERGAEVVAVGTGDTRYARRFVEDERIPYRVLVDDDAQAAKAAAVESSSWLGLLHPRTWAATRATWGRGYRVTGVGKRVTQLGATFVIGPGSDVRYAHLDRDSTDHAPLDEVVAALRTPTT